MKTNSNRKNGGGGIDVMGEDIEPGGVVKNHRTQEPSHERPGKNKTPRRPPPKESLAIVLSQVVQEPQEQQAPAVELPAVSAIKPPEEKKLEEEMENNKAPVIVATRPEFEICPLCGFFNKSVKIGKNGDQKRYLVCKGEDDRYRAYAKKVADELADNKKPVVLTKIEWVLSQLDLERFERELEAARKTRANAEARINERVRVAANGKTLPREVFVALTAKYRQEFSREDYFLVRRLYARLKAAQELKPELERMIAAKAAEPAPANA